jgi:hypothetical protein
VLRRSDGSEAVPIPANQLLTWSNIGAEVTSAAAYASVQNALTRAGAATAGLGLDIFLQGSYANHTQVRADSDVDIVALYDGTVIQDVDRLPQAAGQSIKGELGPVTYRWEQLKEDLLRSLRAQYRNVRIGTKTLKVVAPNGREVDILPAIQFDYYDGTTYGLLGYQPISGIAFFDNVGRRFVNFPKQHRTNGSAKNDRARTGENYKPMVRIFKNLRNQLISLNRLQAGIAPSYFIEGMLWNVPDELFVGPFDQSVPNIINHLVHRPFNTLMCQNGIVPLFGPDVTQWNDGNFTNFIMTTQNAWLNWNAWN